MTSFVSEYLDPVTRFIHSPNLPEAGWWSCSGSSDKVSDLEEFAVSSRRRRIVPRCNNPQCDKQG